MTADEFIASFVGELDFGSSDFDSISSEFFGTLIGGGGTEISGVILCPGGSDDGLPEHFVVISDSEHVFFLI